MGEIIGECNDIVRVESVLVARRALKEGGLNCENASSDSRMLVLLHQLRLGFRLAFVYLSLLGSRALFLRAHELFDHFLLHQISILGDLT